MQTYMIFEMSTGRVVIHRDFPSIDQAGEKRRRLEQKLGRALGLLREIDPATDGGHIIAMVRRYRGEVAA